jgi:hypothetical protein
LLNISPQITSKIREKNFRSDSWLRKEKQRKKRPSKEKKLSARPTKDQASDALCASAPI